MVVCVLCLFCIFKGKKCKKKNIYNKENKILFWYQNTGTKFLVIYLLFDRRR